MKTEKFFKAFTELDDDLIESALPKTNEPEIIRPAARSFSWKPLTAAAAVLVLAGGMTVLGMRIHNSNNHSIAPGDVVSDNVLQESSVSSKTMEDFPVNYSYMCVDYLVYFSVEELVDKSDIVVTGKVTDISFELHDEHTGELLTQYNETAALCTVYDVDVITSYKGGAKEKLRIIKYNGLKDYEVDKQRELVGEHPIPVLENPVEINIGEEYLFVLSQSMSQSSTGDTMTCLVNNSQGYFRTDQPTVKERFSQASLNDIIEFFNSGVVDHSGVESVIHNSQYMTLTEQSSAALMDMVKNALTNNGLKEYDSGAPMLEQDIENYRKNGYVIKIRYNDIDEPISGGSLNKKAQIICDTTVLISEENEPSYIAYSYSSYSFDGASENRDAGTFILSDEFREKILQVLNPQGLTSDNLSVIHNDQNITLSEQSSAALTDAVMQLLTTGGLPELKTAITEQDIIEYGKNGYVVTIKYNYETEINNVTVLIGGEGQTSYIVSSWTAFYSFPPPPDSHTFLLDSSSRDSILEMLNS